MFPAIGVVVVLVMVFGGFLITGGALGPVLAAIPHEMMIIGGSAVGALIAGNSGKELKQLGGGFGKLFKGPQYAKKDYLDVIFLVSRLMKMLRTDGPVAVEPHIEDPKSSPIFAEYPKLLKDDTLIHLISDTLRLVVVSSGTLDPHAVEEVMDNGLKSHHHDAIRFGQLGDLTPAAFFFADGSDQAFFELLRRHDVAVEDDAAARQPHFHGLGLLARVLLLLGAGDVLLAPGARRR